MPLIGRRKSQTGLQLARDNRIVAVSRVENVWQMWGGRKDFCRRSAGLRLTVPRVLFFFAIACVRSIHE